MDEESGEDSQPSVGEGTQSTGGDITQHPLEGEHHKTSGILPNAEKHDMGLEEPQETPVDLERPLLMSQEACESNITSMGPHELTTGSNDSTAELHNSCETNLVLPVHGEPNEQAQQDSRGLFQETHEPDNIPRDLQASSVMELETQSALQTSKEPQDSTAALELPIESTKDVQEEPQGDGCEPLVKLQQSQTELLGPQLELGPEPNEMPMDPAELQEKLSNPEELRKTQQNTPKSNVVQEEALINLEEIHGGQRNSKEPSEKLQNPTNNFSEPLGPPDKSYNLHEHSPVEQELHERLEGSNSVIVNVQETNSMPKSTQSSDLTSEDPNTVLQDPPGSQVELQEPHSEVEPHAEVPGLQEPPDTNTLVNDPTEAQSEFQEPSVGLEESQEPKESLENPQEPGNTRMEPGAIESHAAGGELQEPDNTGVFENLFLLLAVFFHISFDPR